MEEQSAFEAFDLQNKSLKRRRELLPLWIKVFIWLSFLQHLSGVRLLIR